MTTCQCGRDALHCPFCGCATVYGRASLDRVVDDVLIHSYRCRRCAKIFDDITRTSCTAPYKAVARAERAVTQIEKAIEHLSPKERLQWAKDKMESLQQRRKKALKEFDREPSVADEIDSKLEEKE